MIRLPLIDNFAAKWFHPWMRFVANIIYPLGGVTKLRYQSFLFAKQLNNIATHNQENISDAAENDITSMI